MLGKNDHAADRRSGWRHASAAILNGVITCERFKESGSALQAARSNCISACAAPAVTSSTQIGNPRIVSRTGPSSCMQAGRHSRATQAVIQSCRERVGHRPTRSHSLESGPADPRSRRCLSRHFPRLEGCLGCKYQALLLRRGCRPEKRVPEP